jgi:hypothetical protein
MNPEPRGKLTVNKVLLCLALNPYRHLIRRWNWKSAGLSSVFRGILILLANLSAGPNRAAGAMLAESCYRALTSGFYSAFTQSFRFSGPAWAASAIPMILIPIISDSLEITMHGLRGTQRLGATAAASVIFTAISTLFELYIMRHGVLVMGQNRKPLAEDLKRIPKLFHDFLGEGLQLLSTPFRLSGAWIVRRPPATRMIKGCTPGASVSAAPAAEPVD